MKTIKTSKLIAMESIATSITVAPLETGGYEMTIFLKEKRKDGCCRIKHVKVERIIEDTEIPQTSNWTVKHLGYNTYKYFKQPSGFYINLYHKW